MIFVDRGEELKYLKNYILKFPLPLQELPRSRQLLLLIGPKGVGKTSLLRKLVEQGVEDTVFVYVEFRGPYEGTEDLLADMLAQYIEIIRKLKPPWLQVLKKVLVAMGIKLLGEEIVEVLLAPENKEILSKLRPTLVLRRLEKELCSLAGKENSRLVIIYDEFQNFLEVIVSKDRFKPLLKTFITYLSKNQEWGFMDIKGYPIYILSTSDYTFYRLLEEYRGSYLEVMYIKELERKYAIELTKKFLEAYNMEYRGLEVEYMVEILGGNPSVIIEFINKMKATNTQAVLEDIDKLLNKVIEEIREHVFSRLSRASKKLLEELKSMLKEKDVVDMYELMSKSGLEEETFLHAINELLTENILQYVNGKVGFQNNLIKCAITG